MKNLNTNVIEAYVEAAQSITNEGKTSRLCRIYEVDQESKNEYVLYSALISVKTKNVDANNFSSILSEFENNKQKDDSFETEDIFEDYLNAKLSKQTKSTFYFANLYNFDEDQQFNNSIPENANFIAQNEEETKYFETASEAAEFLGLSAKSTKGIYKAIKEEKSYKGYAWTKNI